MKEKTQGKRQEKEAARNREKSHRRDHIRKQSISLQYVGGGVDSLTLFEADIVFDSGD